jgi:hypothetical protein
VDPPADSRPFKFKGNWQIDIGGFNSQEGKDTASAGYLWFDSNLDLSFHKTLNAHIEPVARLYGGRAQERYDDDSLVSRAGVNDAHISFQPVWPVELKGGIHNQKIVDNTMLISRWRAFAGTQEIFRAKAGQFEGRIVLQQVIPNSHSLNTEREKQEALPWFRTEHIEVGGKHWKWLEWKTKAGRYEWSDIPAKVVYESVRTGNAPGATPTVAGSRFAYEHKGWFAGAEACLCSDFPIGLAVEYDRIRNRQAPKNSADAQRWGVGPKIKWPGNTLSVLYRSFFIESDATVSAYNSSRLGGTNRIGDSLEFKLHFERLHFTLYAEAYRAKPINTRGTQQRDMETYYFGLETDYANF